MAGCEPRQLTTVLAATECLLDTAFNAHGVSATTMGATPCTIVSGSGREAAGVNAGMGALGSGSRANGCIGRAVKLVLQNCGGAKLGQSVALCYMCMFAFFATAPLRVGLSVFCVSDKRVATGFGLMGEGSGCSVDRMRYVFQMPNTDVSCLHHRRDGVYDAGNTDEVHDVHRGERGRGARVAAVPRGAAGCTRGRHRCDDARGHVWASSGRRSLSCDPTPASSPLYPPRSCAACVDCSIATAMLVSLAHIFVCQCAP